MITICLRQMRHVGEMISLSEIADAAGASSVSGLEAPDVSMLLTLGEKQVLSKMMNDSSLDDSYDLGLAQDGIFVQNLHLRVEDERPIPSLRHRLVHTFRPHISVRPNWHATGFVWGPVRRCDASRAYAHGQSFPYSLIHLDFTHFTTPALTSRSSRVARLSDICALVSRVDMQLQPKIRLSHTHSPLERRPYPPRVLLSPTHSPSPSPHAA